MVTEEPSWLQDRVSLLVYRLRAAQYGFMFRLAYPSHNVIALISLFLGALAISISINLFGGLLPILPLLATTADLHPLGMSTVGAMAFAAILWFVVRYLGNLSRIMGYAASTSEGAEQIREHMAEGMQNATAYLQLRKLYEETVKAVNDQLHLEGWHGGFEFVQIGTLPQRSHEYAAIALQLTEPTNLENLLEAIDPNTPSRYRQFAQEAQHRQALMRNWRNRGSPERNNYGRRRRRQLSSDGDSHQQQ